MTAESAREFEALEAQAGRIMSAFTRAGYEPVAPAIVQPAGLFFDRIGEAIRSRTYVFTDPNGEELCLRPDLTLPVCRIFLERRPEVKVAKFCYNGPAFRMQEGRPDPLRPREFRQAGIECFGSVGPDADLEVVGLTLDALRSAGCGKFILRLGHIGAFSALLAAIPMPPRWRERLHRAFWRPQAFARELAALAAPRQAAGRQSVYPLTESDLLDWLQEQGISLIGHRSPAEIVRRLADKAADAQEPALPRQFVTLIEDFLRIGGSVPAAMEAMTGLFAQAGFDGPGALAEIETRLAAVTRIAGDTPVIFAAGFGRHFAYYTGLVFQMEIEGKGVAGHVAGGGRYDGLIAALSGGSRDLPAVGAAIHTERLLANSGRC
jgi:ATP phosphoribosyltransferase regulatory subunit